MSRISMEMFFQQVPPSSDTKFLNLVKNNKAEFKNQGETQGNFTITCDEFKKWLCEAVSERGIEKITKPHLDEFVDALVKQRKLDRQTALEFVKSVYSSYMRELYIGNQLFHVDGSTPIFRTPAASPSRSHACSPQPAVGAVEWLDDTLFPMDEDNYASVASVQSQIDDLSKKPVGHISLFVDTSIFSIKNEESLPVVLKLGL